MLWYWVTHPFYKNGPNDMGIGWNLLISLRRVAIGYTLASAIAVGLDILIGISKVAFKAFNPYFQLLKPVSPLSLAATRTLYLPRFSINGDFHDYHRQYLAHPYQYCFWRSKCRF